MPFMRPLYAVGARSFIAENGAIGIEFTLYSGRSVQITFPREALPMLAEVIASLNNRGVNGSPADDVIPPG